MTRLLFVCMGNICRSPAAEAVMRRLAADAGRTDIEVDSAGTIGYHAGEDPDPRMQAVAAARGYAMSHSARRISAWDYETFDLILTMDDRNYDDVCSRAPSPEAQQKVHRLADYCRHKVVDSVPDPYYGGTSGFINVIDILEDACAGLLASLDAG